MIDIWIITPAIKYLANLFIVRETMANCSHAGSNPEALVVQ
jgi:hypothetical protein